MLSYKKWKSLNENYDSSLGIATPQAVGIMSSAGATLEELIAERKKMKKKMLGERPDMGDEQEDDDETGDGEVVEPTSIKDKIKDDDGDDHGDEEGDDDEDMDDGDDDADDMGDDDGDDMGDEKGGNPLLSKIQMMKKKMKNKMKKKCSSGKSMKKKMAAESAEETEAHDVEGNDFIQSIAKMMSGGDGQRNWDGISPKNEDALLPIIDPNTGYAIGNYGDPAPGEGQPQPGEVGFAPQGKIGDFFGN